VRLLNKTEFLKLPEGIVYVRGGRWFFNGLTIKGETVTHYSGSEPRDWYEIDITQIKHSDSGQHFDRLQEMLDSGKSYPLEISSCRNGLYEDDDLFLVYEKADLDLLIKTLQEAVPYE